MAQKHPPLLPFFFLLHLKIAVILLSRRTRFDVRFLDFGRIPFHCRALEGRRAAAPPSRVSDHSCRENTLLPVS